MAATKGAIAPAQVAQNPQQQQQQEPLPEKPSVIEQDIKEMERKNRVKLVMNSQMFREELERIVEGQFSNSGALAGIAALTQVNEILQGRGFTTSSLLRGPNIIPINDIRGVESFRFDNNEKLIRCKVAAVYRLIDLNGWSQNIYNHISARLDQEHEHFLINPFGLQYNEITASSLVKIDIQGNLIDQGSTNFVFNRAGFNLHAAIHKARPDLKAIIHIHHPPVVAVSAYKKGLLPLSQEAAIIGDVSYFDYTGILVESAEQDAIANSLGIHNKVMILRNHGVVACGADIEEAFFYLTNIVKACEIQVKLLPVGIENLSLMTKEAIERTRETIKHSSVFGKDGDGLDAASKQRAQDARSPTPSGGRGRRSMSIIAVDFEANMRMLDNLGYRTGYVYKNPVSRREERVKHDVEEPPTVTSIQQDYFDEKKWLDPLKKLEAERKKERIAWVNSPNVYQRKDVLETGTHDPKIITRWVQDEQFKNNTARIDGSSQFAPHTVDINEFKQRQKAMKELRLSNTVSGGPQSQILEGVTWDELKTSANDPSQTIIVGAASKGIIQRDHQHNANLYQSPYAKNPFDDIGVASEKHNYAFDPNMESKDRVDVGVEKIAENSASSPLSDEEAESTKKKGKSKKKGLSFLKSKK